MNRFRAKKKGKEEVAGGLSSPDGESSASSSFKSFRRAKKSQEDEPKKVLDLTTALPSENDFRTSLLMTNLSARFSMLREQDDPNTKIGKASDDSVLFPKRQSRLGDFGYGSGDNGLSDIAEVESLHAASSLARKPSFVSEEAEKTGSIMNRSKPMEGNVLFGGRQKIYKIPAGISLSRGLATGTMPGKALYDDDVAKSAFQRWRQGEKGARANGEVHLSRGPCTMQSDGEDDFEHGPRGETEGLGLTSYEKKRETSSTTYSALARNSTASNSIVSQPAASVKDWQSTSTAPTSIPSTPALERNSVTRTRRLYEQGLNQELHEQQSSALYRMDTLTRQRTFGNRTPDLGGANSPSPTSIGFGDRLGDRRPMPTKSSAPNLRSISPPTSGSSTATMKFGTQAPFQTESKSLFAASPPLSPPMSDGGEHPALSIQPKDHGKATAMGVFHKPSQAYDETKYAQRQIQLQQGREPPGPRLRTDSNASCVTGRSSSSSSAQGLPFDAKATAAAAKPGSPVSENDAMVSLLGDASPKLPGTSPFASTTHLVPERPSDEDHPAFRQSALPTPLVFGAKESFEASKLSRESNTAAHGRHPESWVDSPTLSSSAGLSGLVHHHLRSDSNTSSVYGAAPQCGDGESQNSLHAHYASIVDILGGKRNIGSQGDRDGTGPQPSQPTLADLRSIPYMYMDPPTDVHEQTDAGREEETDEFANQLADARRRVREKLTSFVDSDGSRSSSPVQSELPPPQPNSLGVGMLKPKGSRGSLIDRSRSIISGQIKGQKALGLGAATMTTSPSPNRPSFEDKDEDPTPGTPSHVETARDGPVHGMRTTDQDSEVTSADAADETGGYTGPRAFRQVRRDMRNRREQESMARHRAISGHEGTKPTAGQSSPLDDTAARRWQRTPSGDRMSSRSRPSVEREHDRSVPDGSSRDRPPPGPRDHSTPGLEVSNQLAPALGQRGGSRSRSPGLPGTDIRRSPIVPPQAYPGSSRAMALRPAPSSQAAHTLDRSRSAGNLQVEAGQGNGLTPGQPSALSGPNGSVNSTPVLPPLVPSRQASAPQLPSGPTTNSTLNERHKRLVNKKDISEPTFVMSTSRVPTVNLPQFPARSDHRNGSHSRTPSCSRSDRTGNGNSPSSAPPLPVINPRRNRESSRTRAAIDALRGRSRPDVPEDAALEAPQALFARPGAEESPDSADDNRSALSVSDDENGGRWDQRMRLRKANTDAFNMNSRLASPSKAQDHLLPYVVRGPPASRSVVTGGLMGSSKGDGAQRGMI